MRKKNTVSYGLNPDQIPPLTEAQRAELKALETVPEEQIDTSDIPLLSEAFWRNAVRNPFYRPIKQQRTVRLDADVLTWLRSEGRGYQTKLNAILREAMLREVTMEASPGKRTMRQHANEIPAKPLARNVQRRLHTNPHVATSPATSNGARSPWAPAFAF